MHRGGRFIFGSATNNATKFAEQSIHK